MIISLISHLKKSLRFEFYPQIAPEFAKLPCGVYNIISETERISVNLGSYQSDFIIQLDIYTNTYKEADLLKDEVKKALFSFERPIVSLSCNISKDNEIYRLIVEFKSFV